MITERFRIERGQCYWIECGLSMMRVKITGVHSQHGASIVEWRGRGLWFFYRRTVTGKEFLDAMVKRQ